MSQANPIRSALADFLGQLPLVERVAGRILSAGASVFMFHRILPRKEECYEPEMATSQDLFADFLDWLNDHFRVEPLDELVARGGKPDGKRPLCAITFDDGWIDHYLHAFPLLKERGLPASIFLPVRFIGTNRRFWQERLWLTLRDLEPARHRQELISAAALHFPWFPLAGELYQSGAGLKRLLMTRPSQEAEEFVHHLAESAGLAAAFSDRAFLNWDEVREMCEMGISFGSHTLNHVLLTQMDPAEATVEIQRSREELTERLGSEVSGFSYPWGAASSLTREAVRGTGYGFAFTTHPGLVKDAADPWLLPRIAISNSVLKSGAGRLATGKAQLWFVKNALFPSASVAPLRVPGENGKRIKITFVIDQITEWEGGTERQLLALIRALDRDYFKPELCFLFPTEELPRETLPCPARWVCSDKAHLPNIAVRLFRLTRLLRQTRPQIVQTFFIEGIFVGILAAWLAGVPRIVGSARNAGYWKKFRHRMAFRSVAGLAHRWQCNSRALWDYVRKIEGVLPQRIEILPNAIDLSQFAAASLSERLVLRRQLGLGEDNPVIVSVANFAPVKDLPTFLEAAKLFHTQFPNAEFVLVGEGPLRAELQLQAERLGLTRAVRFVGRQADVRPFLAAADFGVLTSRSEGSANSVLEYMAMGLPSVVSDIPANRELVKGLFFVPGDAADLAQKLMLLWRNTALHAELRAQYAQTVSEFSLEKFVLRVQSFYTKLAAEYV